MSTDKDSGMNGKIKYNLQSIDSNIDFNHNQSLFELNQNGSLQILYPIKQISRYLNLRILLEDYGSSISTNINSNKYCIW